MLDQSNRDQFRPNSNYYQSTTIAHRFDNTKRLVNRGLGKVAKSTQRVVMQISALATTRSLSAQQETARILIEDLSPIRRNIAPAGKRSEV